MAAMESASSCGPQANSHPEPPRAQAPKPTGVILRSEFPKFRVSIRIIFLSRAVANGLAANVFSLTFFNLDEGAGKKLEGMRRNTKSGPPNPGRRMEKGFRLVCDEGSVQRDGFAVGICDDDLLRAGGDAGSCYEKSVGILEGDAGWFSTDGNYSATLKTAAADGESRAAGCCNSGGRNGADSQGNSGEVNNGPGSLLGRAIRGGEGEQPLAIFVGSEKVAVKAVDIGEELLRKINS